MTISKDDPFADISLSRNRKSSNLIEFKAKTVNTDLDEILEDEPLVVEAVTYFPSFDGTKDSSAYNNQRYSVADTTRSSSGGSNHSSQGDRKIPKHAPWRNK